MCVCDYICMCIGMQNIFIHAMCVYLRRARKTQLQIIMKIKLLPIKKKKKLQQRLLTLPQSECMLKKNVLFFNFSSFPYMPQLISFLLEYNFSYSPTMINHSYSLCGRKTKNRSPSSYPKVRNKTFNRGEPYLKMTEARLTRESTKTFSEGLNIN